MTKKIGIEDLYHLYLKHPVISKDSRKISEGCIYFALSGENFNGNQFAEEAIEKGAAYAVIDQTDYKKDDRYLLVDDSLKYLQDLARKHRSQLSIPIIGITGSNGKTTTKELISRVLSAKYKTYATEGNYNNHIGVPLSILNIHSDHEMAVIEMGANHQGEIAFLSEISNPDFGLITNIGKAHLEGFGGIEGVKKGKSELYKHLAKRDGLVFVNRDDEVLMELSEHNRSITYGQQSGVYCEAELNQSHPQIRGEWKCDKQSGKIRAQIYGSYNFYNLLAAICIGCYFEVDARLIDQQINSYTTSNNRSEIRKMKDHTIYLDAYNANPTSSKAAIDNFAELEENPKNKLLILGDMFELGSDSKAEHEAIIGHALNNEFGQRIFIGQHYSSTGIRDDRLLFFPTTEEAKSWYQKLEKKGLHILIKGSRGMALEKLLEV